MRGSSRLLNCLDRLRRDRRGALAPIAAIVGVVLVLAAGSAVDLGRAARLRSLLQDDADNAALAGAAQASSDAALASAKAYVNATVANLSDKPTVTPTYNYDGSNVTSPVMTVTLTANLPTSLMSMVVPTIPVTVTSKASGSIMKQITISLTNFNSDAADTNAMYAYGYDPTAYSGTSLYKFAPTAASTTGADGWQCIFINKTDSKQPSCKVPSASYQKAVLQIPWADNVAFALSNTTGTGANCYGMKTGANTMYYSTRLDSSGQYHDYPTVSINYCGYAVYTMNSDSTYTVDNYQDVTPGQNYANQCQSCEYQSYTYNCGTRTQPNKTCTGSQAPSGAYWNLGLPGSSKLAYGYIFPQSSSRNPLTMSSPTLDCTNGSTVTYNWDDNGGGTDSGITSSSSSADDDDHNDLDFTVTCTKVVGQSGARLIN